MTTFVAALSHPVVEFRAFNTRRFHVRRRLVITDSTRSLGPLFVDTKVVVGVSVALFKARRATETHLFTVGIFVALVLPTPLPSFAVLASLDHVRSAFVVADVAFLGLLLLLQRGWRVGSQWKEQAHNLVAVIIELRRLAIHLSTKGNVRTIGRVVVLLV